MLDAAESVPWRRRSLVASGRRPLAPFPPSQFGKLPPTLSPAFVNWSLVMTPCGNSSRAHKCPRLLGWYQGILNRLHAIPANLTDPDPQAILPSMYGCHSRVRSLWRG